MGKHTKTFSLCAWAGKSECLHLAPACIHPNPKNSVHLLFIVYTEALQGMFYFQCQARISSYLVCFTMDMSAKKV